MSQPADGAARVDRVVSLLPAATEMVAALGLRDALVGRSHECDYPPGVEQLPICSVPRLDVHAAGARIDRDVRELLRDGLSVFEVHADVLRGLRPQAVVTQMQCAVCAVSEDQLRAAVASWLDTGPRLVSLSGSDLGGVWRDLLAVAVALGVPDAGHTAVAALEARIARLARTAGGLSVRPRVACLEWLEPLMGAGNWMPELVSLAGGQALFGAPGEHSPWLDWTTLVAADPDVVLIAPCGFDLSRTRSEVARFAGQAELGRLRAARAGRVYLADGHGFFNRPGPRLVESLEILCEMLHPGHFDFGHRGAAYLPWS